MDRSRPRRRFDLRDRQIWGHARIDGVQLLEEVRGPRIVDVLEKGNR